MHKAITSDTIEHQPTHLVGRSVVSIVAHHDPQPQRRNAPILDWDHPEVWAKTFTTIGSPQPRLRDRPWLLLDREFDIVNRAGVPLFSGFEAGPVDRRARKQALAATTAWGSARFVTFPVGVDRQHACCRPVVVQGAPTPAGMRCEVWMAHGWQADGPDGWHLRVYGADGSVMNEATIEILGYPRRNRYFDPDRTQPL